MAADMLTVVVLAQTLNKVRLKAKSLSRRYHTHTPNF